MVDFSNHTEPIRTTRGRWKACSVAHPTTPQWSGMVESTSRHRLGKLTLLNPIFGHFWAVLGPEKRRVLVDFSKHTEPIPTTRGSLESLFGSASNDTTMVGNGSGYFEIQAWEVDFAQPKNWAFWSFLGHFWAKNNPHMWDFSLSKLNQSGPLGVVGKPTR